MIRKVLFVFTIVVVAWACSKSEDDKEVIPTIDNLAGAWEAIDYKLDGENVFGAEYEEDCIFVQANKEFTARLSMRGGYLCGDVTMLGNDLKMETFDETIGMTVTKMTRTTFTAEYNYNGGIYTMTFKRVIKPTTFQVKNDMFSGNKMINLISYCVDGDEDFVFIYGNVHGTALVGETSRQKVFTRHPGKMRIGCNVLDGYIVRKYISAYPQKMDIGKHNILSLTDTMMVIDISSAGSKTVSKPIMLKDILEE